MDAGTKVTVKWPSLVWEGEAVSLLELARDAFTRLAESYAWFNPHLTLRGTGTGKNSSMLQQPIPLGKNGVRAIRPARIGTTRHGYSDISPPT
jgi:hypothetical protein